jgi:hypothetical protein
VRCKSGLRASLVIVILYSQVKRPAGFEQDMRSAVHKSGPPLRFREILPPHERPHQIKALWSLDCTRNAATSAEYTPSGSTPKSRLACLSCHKNGKPFRHGFPELKSVPCDRFPSKHQSARTFSSSRSRIERASRTITRLRDSSFPQSHPSFAMSSPHRDHDSRFEHRTQIS